MPSVSHRPILQMRLGQFQADGLSIASVSQGRADAAAIWAFPVRKAVYHCITKARTGNAPSPVQRRRKCEACQFGVGGKGKIKLVGLLMSKVLYSSGLGKTVCFPRKLFAP